MSQNYFSAFAERNFKEPLKGLKVREVHLKNLMMTHMELAPQLEVPEHSHPHEQITMILQGELELTVDAETKVMKQGDVVSVPGGIKHKGRALTYTVAIDAWSPVREDYIV